MTYGALRDYALQLLDRYSVAGTTVASSYNNQADALARIPALTRDALYYLATSVCRLRTVAQLEHSQKMQQWQVFDLPQDCYQMAGGLIRLRGQTMERFREYRLVGGQQVWIPDGEEGPFLVEYFRYPRAPLGEENEYLDCAPEAQSAAAFYVAAHLAMEDDGNLYAALYNEFERKLARLQPAPQTQWEAMDHVYETV